METPYTFGKEKKQVTIKNIDAFFAPPIPITAEVDPRPVNMLTLEQKKQEIIDQMEQKIDSLKKELNSLKKDLLEALGGSENKITF